MSENYQRQVNLLYFWFKKNIQQISDIKPFRISAESFARGADGVHGSCRAMRDAAFTIWLWEHNYELSYSQMTSALFHALIDTGRMTLPDGVEYETTRQEFHDSTTLDEAIARCTKWSLAGSDRAAQTEPQSTESPK